MIKNKNNILYTSFFVLICFFVSGQVVFALEMPKDFTRKMLPTLVLGKSNEDVLFLKKTLHDFGYFQVEEEEPAFTRKFDNELKEAVLDFQKSNELKILGEINLETLRTLNGFLTFRDEQLAAVESPNNFLVGETGSSSIFFEFSGKDVDETYGGKIDQNYELSKDPPKKKSIISSLLDSFFGLKKPEPLKTKIEKKSTKSNFNIFTCFTDPVCSKVK